MSAVMLLLCYLPMTMIIIILYVVLYCMYNLIIVSAIFCRSFLYESCVSIIMKSSSELSNSSKL